MTPDQDVPREFTDEQLNTALQRAGRQAWDEALAAGLSVTFVEADRLLAIHPDGRIEDLGPADEPEVVIPK